MDPPATSTFLAIATPAAPLAQCSTCLIVTRSVKPVQLLAMITANSALQMTCPSVPSAKEASISMMKMTVSSATNHVKFASPKMHAKAATTVLPWSEHLMRKTLPSHLVWLVLAHVPLARKLSIHV